jgi:hypothetical protein
LTEAEEIADGVKARALDALWPNSWLFSHPERGPEDEAPRDHKAWWVAQNDRIAAIRKTIKELEAKSD